MGDNAFGYTFLGAQGVGGFQKSVLLGPRPSARSERARTVDVDGDAVLVKQWSETDFRTNENPWWA